MLPGSKFFFSFDSSGCLLRELAWAIVRVNERRQGKWQRTWLFFYSGCIPHGRACDVCSCPPFSTVAGERDAFARSGLSLRLLYALFPFSTGSHRETLVCACLSLRRFLTFFLRSFPFSTGSQKETLVCARLSLRFLTFFNALFPFPQDHRKRRLCAHAFLYDF